MRLSPAVTNSARGKAFGERPDCARWLSQTAATDLQASRVSQSGEGGMREAGLGWKAWVVGVVHGAPDRGAANLKEEGTKPCQPLA